MASGNKLAKDFYSCLISIFNC